MGLKACVAALAAGTVMQLSGMARAADAERQERFISGGVPIGVEWFGAAGADGKAPAIVMLHGSDGLSRADRYRAGARRLAADGYHVALVHYLDRTGEKRASIGTAVRNFGPWLMTVRDAVTWVAHRPDVDPHRMAVLGISLGGALGVAIASADTRVKALVDYFGPLPQGLVNGNGVLPPTLILHGAADPIVPVSNAYAIENLLRSQGTQHEIQVYPGQGHGFHGANQDDADRRVSAFLRRHIGDGASAPQQAGNGPGAR